jgi:hypothetical protein
VTGTLFNSVQAFFEVVHFRAELAIEAFGFGIQLVLLFDFFLKLDQSWNTAFAKPNLSLQDQQQGDQDSWQKAVFHEH